MEEIDRFDRWSKASVPGGLTAGILPSKDIIEGIASGMEVVGKELGG